MLPLIQRAFEGKYQVEREIGKGGNARIYLARDPQGRRVALKVLHPELLVSVAADRFLREIQLSSRLEHPHIARRYGAVDRKACDPRDDQLDCGGEKQDRNGANHAPAIRLQILEQAAHDARIIRLAEIFLFVE